MSITLLLSSINIIFAIPIISFIHELGLLFTAWIFKVNIKEISLGVGPIIFIRKIYAIRLFPLLFHIEWDSKKLRNKFLSLPYEKNYGCIMAPKPSNKYYFEDISFWKQSLILFSGLMANVLLFLFILVCCLAVNFPEISNFFKFFFAKLFYAFNYIANKNSPQGGNLNIYFFHALAMLNCFFIFINFFPFYYLDGHRIFINFYEKITKKSINWIVGSIVYICSVFILSLIFYGFFVSWWN